MELLEVLKRHLVEIPQLMHLAYVSICQHTLVYVSIRQQTSANVSIRQQRQQRRLHPVIHARIQERCRIS